MILECYAVQVNLSSPGSTSPVDHWHTDSIAYAGVVILSDMRDMKGGELELYRGHADEGRRLLRTSGGIPSEQVKQVGRCRCREPSRWSE